MGTTAQAMVRAVNDMADAAAELISAVRQQGPGVIIQRIRDFDVTKVDMSTVNLSLVLLLTVLMGITIMIVLANVVKEEPAPGIHKENRALGAGSAAIEKANAPPIPPPTEVVSLRVYPIKSCRGFEVDHTRLRKSGLTLDRNWMFVSKKDMNFMTIRTDSSMTLIDTTITEGEPEGKEGRREQFLGISISGTDKFIQIPAFPTPDWLKANTTLTEVEIWEQKTDGYEYGPDINKIFCDFFNKDVALVYKGPSTRPVAVNGSKELYGKETPHHFADVMSLQIASEASIKDLNKKLKAKDPKSEELTIERFRPNIIVKGRDDHPWEEDTWKRIRLLTVIPSEEALYKIDLDVVARCARCQVPNVNPETGKKHDKEPWTELMRYRRVDKGGVAKYKPCFGMLCLPKNDGRIVVGARLEVLETTDKHSYNEARFEDL
ncbi:hypothetical protein LTR62_006764 [Meristemomyces frigidus]|uniref:MOSC domain-containing protein n=1 Tax=Meristemomyces frigidus TaxID=1508187 RepID=A0AAN7TVT4_9PEZI|nr:hypothetical protein LTR62_006764 [Meristemomyces frigidus]